MSDLKLPKEGEIQDGELWFSRRGNILTLGLTTRAVDSLGDLEDIGLPEEGDIFEQGDAIVSVDGNRSSLELAAPGRGTVLEVNPVAKDPETVSSDPLDEGWLLKFQIDDMDDLKYLMTESSSGSSSKDDDEEEEDDSDEDDYEDEEEEDEDDDDR